MRLTDQLNALREVRAEIRRLNEAAGRTVFNPTATTLLDDVIIDLALQRMETEEELMDDGETRIVPAHEDGLRACRFYFVEGPNYDGFTDGTTWNGFANVWVKPEVRDQIVTDIRANDPDDEHAAQLASEQPDEAGLVSLAKGWAAELTEDD